MSRFDGRTARDCPVHGVAGDWCTDECGQLARDLRRSHVCENEAVEHGDSEPRPSGEIELWKVCGVCGRTLARGTDRVLP